jgi:hypothetical protein
MRISKVELIDFLVEDKIETKTVAEFNDVDGYDYQCHLLSDGSFEIYGWHPDGWEKYSKCSLGHILKDFKE